MLAEQLQSVARIKAKNKCIEEWRTPSGDKDYSKGENLFRPTKRVSKKTATTYGELTKSELRAAQREKNSKGRVSRFKKKKKK